MDHAKKCNRIRKISSCMVKKQKTDGEKYSWAKPYDDPNIDNVYTGLGKQFNYSPIFKNTIADTMVKLTGYRTRDYIVAENQTGKIHIPYMTVWHHAWQEKDGLYRMQLVDFNTHKMTCPHAGGCRLWIKNTKSKLKYNSYKREEKTGYYTDIATFYSIDALERDYYQKGYVSRRTLICAKRKGLKLIGIDMYGNLLYESRKGKYFWDHENDCLTPLNRVSGKTVIK